MQQQMQTRPFFKSKPKFYYTSVFSDQAIDYLRRLIRRKQPLDEFVKEYLEEKAREVIHYRLVGQPRDVLSLLKDQEVVYQYREILELKELVETLLVEIMRVDLTGRKTEKEEIQTIWSAVDRFYRQKKASLLFSYEGKMSDDVLQRGQRYMNCINFTDLHPLVEKMFRVNEFGSNPTEKYLSFTVKVIWKECPKLVYRHVTGTFQLESQPAQDALQNLLRLYVQNKLWGMIRGDCEWQFSKLKKTASSWQVDVFVRQNLVNVPAQYYFQFDFDLKEVCHVRNLMIGNEYGSVKWGCEINLREVDFSQGAIIIEEHSITCNHSTLNQPCTVTYFTLPKALLQHQADKEQRIARLNRQIESQDECTLLSIDFDSKQYTVSIPTFGQLETSERLKEQKEGLTESLSACRKKLKVNSVSSVVQHGICDF